MIPSSGIEDVRAIGDTFFSEYHCSESSESKDSELWYRSHQRITVLGFLPNDGFDIQTFEERCELGCPIMYRVRFDDEFVGDAFEDELLDSEDEYCRPNPPKVVEGCNR